MDNDDQSAETLFEPDTPLIVIAHSDPALRREMATELADYELYEASDGQAALELAREKKPDAILAGAEMPGLTGIELCQALGADSELSQIRVALVTAPGEETFEAAIKAGAAEVVRMPFSAMELHHRLRSMLQGDFYLRELERKDRVILEALSDLKESEAMLVQAEKLSLLGEMSAGIVHEINNPLNYSKSALFVLQRMIKDMEAGEEREEFAELVEDVTDGVERVGQIVHDLRSFAMKGTMEVSQVDLKQVVRTATRLIGNRLCDIKYVEEISEGLLVRGNENNLCQVLLNLIKNGMEATEAAGRNHDEAEIRVTAEERPDGVVRLLVRDNGCGITAKDRARLYEPFFTTKDRSRGMGLGLSICRRILGEHGASIEVESQLGEFTEFTLSFPLGCEGEAEGQPEEGNSQIQEPALDYQ